MIFTIKLHEHILCDALLGWFLSMKPEDSFIPNLIDETRPLFLPRNDKTLGMAVVSIYLR